MSNARRGVRGTGYAHDPRRRHDRVVADEENGAAGGLVHLAQQIAEGTAGGGIEVAGRLVGQHDGGVVDQRAGDGHALPLAAAESGGQMAAACRQCQPFEQRLERLRIRRAAFQQQRQVCSSRRGRMRLKS